MKNELSRLGREIITNMNKKMLLGSENEMEKTKKAVQADHTQHPDANGKVATKKNNTLPRDLKRTKKIKI